ncbi:hypothetical protein KQI01_06995, partial [Vibrio cholerae]|nr:hypothetical protein [Vibrio cholerae]
AIINNETNSGTANVITNIVRQKFLCLIPFDSINKANNTPKKNVVTVAATAHINVHPKTGKNVPAKSPLRTLPNALNAVHENPIE